MNVTKIIATPTNSNRFTYWDHIGMVEFE